MQPKLAGHTCAPKHSCFKPCPPCKVVMTKTLSCGDHQKKLQCHVDPASLECGAPCVRRVERCNHKCGKKCFEPCEPCLVRTCPSIEHATYLSLENKNINPNVSHFYQTVVQKRSPCGHPQKTKCSEAPSETRCEELVRPREMSLCLHETLVPCRLKYSSKDTIVLAQLNYMPTLHVHD
jgi:hypothetical protein